MTNDANAALIERDQEHLIHPLHSSPVHSNGRIWVRGEGAYLHDANGDAFIDGLAGLWNNTCGNGRRELADAAIAQMGDLAYASGYAGSSNARAIELAERLARLAYPNVNRFFFTSGGGEATDSNIKMARYYWKLRGKPGKHKVIARELGYHGVTLAAMCATGISAYWPMFEPRMPGFSHIPSPYPYRYEAPEGESQGIAAANELEKKILEEGPDTVAMFIAEPVHGAGGVIPPAGRLFPAHPRDLRPVRRAALLRRGHHRLRAHRPPNVRTRALGRAARPHPVRQGDHLRVLPARRHRGERRDCGHDGGKREALDARVYLQRSTPWAVRSRWRLSTSSKVRTFPTQAREKGKRLLVGLKDALADHPNVGDIRGLGLMCGVEVVKDRATKAQFTPEDGVGPRLMQAMVSHKLFTRLKGEDVICLAPPIMASNETLDDTVAAVRDSVHDVFGAG